MATIIGTPNIMSVTYTVKTVLKLRPKTRFKCRRFTCSFESSHQLLTTHYGWTSYKATDYIKRHNLSNRCPEAVMKVINFCESVGFNQSSIFRNPILLRMHLSTLDQYYNVMNEGGFKNITAYTVAKFRSHYRKKILTLKEEGLIDHKTDVATNFIKHLNPCPENFQVETANEFDSWSDVHLKVMTEYLKWRLQTTDQGIEHLIKIHPNIYRKSFKYMCENIAIAEGLGFSPERMLKCGYILHAYPKYTKEVLEKYPTIAGTCMRKAMRMYPKLITTLPSNFEKIYNILKDHGISDEAINKRMNVFHMSPETVDLRLRELERISDFKVLLHNPNILKLVVHHNRAKSRLSFLKQLQLKCSSVSVLGNDNSKFDIHIREGKDATSSADIYAFLKGIFKKKVNEFEATLKRHPYFLLVPLTSMEDTYLYLKNEKFTNPSILKVVYILLYPKDKIANAFKQVEVYEKQRKKILTQVNKLNLALYFIERDHHFTGDGIWVKSESVEETEHIS